MSGAALCYSWHIVYWMGFMKQLLVLLLLIPMLAPADQESDFLAAREAFRTGNGTRLDGLYERLKETPLEPYLAYYRLRMHWDDAGYREAIRTFLARPDEAPVIDQFRGEWLKHLGKQQHWDEFAAEYPHLVNADDELVCYALHSVHASDVDKALQGARDLWMTSAAKLPEHCAALFDAAVQADVISREDVWRRVKRVQEAGNLALLRQTVRYLPANERFAVGDLSTAAANPQRYLDKAKGDAVEQAGRRTVVALALQRLARQSPALAYARWEKVASRFSAEEQQYVYGWFGYAAAREHDPQALAWFEQAGEASLSEQQLAWRARAALRVLNWHEVWASIHAMTPEQQNEMAWRYWKARALKELGHGEEAEELFAPLSREYNFYGQLAAEELGAAPAAALVSASFQPKTEELEAMQNRPGIQRTLLLYHMGLRTEAAKEWDWALRGLGDRELLVAAEVARRNEMYDRSINAANRTVALHDFNLRYPAPYREVLQQPIREHNLEEAWVYGLMRQESRFAAHAKSDVGAAGLMQIMPETARWAARRIGLKGYRKGLIHQLDVNLRLGTYYMKSVYSQFDDSPVLASTAYNAGPTRARKWRADIPLEGAIYIETIPFEETRDYVKKVMSNTIYYAKLFGQPADSLKQRLGVVAARNAQNQQAASDEM